VFWRERNMTEVALSAEISVFENATTGAQTAVLATISKDEFERTKTIIGDLARYDSYQDWLDTREGFQIGLAMAGVDVKCVAVAVTPLLAWCRLTNTSPSEQAMDAFARLLLALRAPPRASAHAIVRRDEFDSHADAVEAFARHRNYSRWRRHRDRLREERVSSGLRVEEFPVRIEDFLAWSRCLKELPNEEMLDRYSELVLEYLVEEEQI
jgi:hypothetical protein